MKTDTIAAIATAMAGSGIGIVRISGEEAVSITDQIFHMPGGKKLSDMETHTIHYGHPADAVPSAAGGKENCEKGNAAGSAEAGGIACGRAGNSAAPIIMYANLKRTDLQIDVCLIPLRSSCQCVTP